MPITPLLMGNLQSHLTRGAWIEMAILQLLPDIDHCRTSHEVRGLKFYDRVVIDKVLESHLTRGAWIEIKTQARNDGKRYVAPHTRCVD